MCKLSKDKTNWKFLVIVIFVAVIAGGGILWWQNYEAQKPIACTQEAKICPDGSYVARTGPNCEFAPCPATNTDQTAGLAPSVVEGWQTHTNEEYGFEMKYPKEWRGHINQFIGPPSMVFCPPEFFAENNDAWLTWADTSEKGCASKRRIWEESDNNVLIEGIGTVTDDVYTKDWQEKINKPIFSVKISEYEEKDNLSQNTALFNYLGENQFGFWYLSADTDKFPEYKLIVSQIISTFRLIETSTSDEPAILPVIDSIFPASGPVGTVIEIKGKNFAGFEGDLDAWIENNEGKKGFIHIGNNLGGNNDSTDKLLKFTLKSSYFNCNNSYSGLPCSGSLSVIPGVYKIYAYPWGTKSNEVTFTVTE